MPHSKKDNKTCRISKLPDKYNDFVLNVKLPTKSDCQPKHDKEHKNIKINSHAHGLFSKPQLKATKMRKRTKIPAFDVSSTIKQLGIDNMLEKNYLPSSIDNFGLVKVKKVDVLKKFDGRGLFAEKFIKKGTTIGEYTGKQFSKKEFQVYLESNVKLDNSYAMTLGQYIIDAQEQGNHTRYINFSDSQANVEFVEGQLNQKKIVKVVAVKDIEVGKQLLIDYNTIDEKKSMDYLYLNPEDGHQSAAELYDENKNLYMPLILKKKYARLDLDKNDNIYVTKIAKALFENKDVKVLNTEACPLDYHLPCLRMNKSKKITDFNEADVFTPIMLACSMGQLDNVKELIKMKVRIDQQQNQSGRCPLFFALEGYAASKKNRVDFFQILKELIKNNANIQVYDRESKTFIHKAINILSNKDFESITNHIKVHSQNVMSQLFSFIDENGDDIVITCIKNKMFDKLDALLKLYPAYFKEGYQGKDLYTTKFNKDAFTKALEDYSDEEKSELHQTIIKNKRMVEPRLLEQLGLEKKFNQFRY